MADDKKLKLAPVIILETVTTHDVSTERVLNGAVAANLSSVIVIGYGQDGEFYFASTAADGPSVIWDLEMAKKMLLEAKR